MFVYVRHRRDARADVAAARVGSARRACCCWLTATSRPGGCGAKPPRPGRTCCGGPRRTCTCPATGTVTTRTELFRLLTTITDPAMASAPELAGCYRQRWESETCYQSVKTHQRGPRTVLRSTDPDGVRQEIYAYLITYQAIRHLISQAATEAGIDPDRLSFTTALRAARRWITTAATATAAVLTTARTATLTEISHDQHHRRNRTSPNATPSTRHQPTSTSSRTHTHDQQQRLSSWDWG